MIKFDAAMGVEIDFKIGEFKREMQVKMDQLEKKFVDK